MAIAIKREIIKDQVWAIRPGSGDLPTLFSTNIIPPISIGKDGDLCEHTDGTRYEKIENKWVATVFPATHNNQEFYCEVKQKMYDDEVINFINLPEFCLNNKNFFKLYKYPSNEEINIDLVIGIHSLQHNSFINIYYNDEITTNAHLIDRFFINDLSLNVGDIILVKYTENKSLKNFNMFLNGYNFDTNEFIQTKVGDPRLGIPGTTYSTGIRSFQIGDIVGIIDLDTEPLRKAEVTYRDSEYGDSKVYYLVPNMITIRNFPLEFDFLGNNQIIEVFRFSKRVGKKHSSKLGYFVGSFSNNKMKLRNITDSDNTQTHHYYKFRIRDTLNNIVSNFFDEALISRRKRMFNSDSLENNNKIVTIYLKR
jgi:hypothetical protein